MPYIRFINAFANRKLDKVYIKGKLVAGNLKFGDATSYIAVKVPQGKDYGCFDLDADDYSLNTRYQLDVGKYYTAIAHIDHDKEDFKVVEDGEEPRQLRFANFVNNANDVNINVNDDTINVEHYSSSNYYNSCNGTCVISAAIEGTQHEVAIPEDQYSYTVYLLGDANQDTKMIVLPDTSEGHIYLELD